MVDTADDDYYIYGPIDPAARRQTRMICIPGVTALRQIIRDQGSPWTCENSCGASRQLRRARAAV
jgi:hypothetical protein